MRTIKQRLSDGELVRALGVGRLLHHNLIQMIGLHGGFEGLWFDMEHMPTSVTDLEIACVSARSVGLDTFTRIAPTDYAIVTRCLEAGTSGIMFAQIHSAEQARECVRWTKFHPDGCRGLNTGGYDARFATLPVPEFCERANRDSFVAMQIETTGSLEECEQIAAIDGVDLLFVGPSDLSQALGIPGDVMNPRCIAAVERVAKGCRDHGKPMGAVALTPEHAAMLLENGCRLISPSNDVKLLNAGLGAVQRSFANCFE